MNLADLLVSYKQIKTPTRVLPGIPTLEVPQFQTPAIQPSEETKESTKPSTQDSVDRVRRVVSAPTIKGSEEFEQAYNEVEKNNPEAKKYRAFLTKMAQQESGFNKSIQNRAGAPAYGYFQFMEDGKKYNNISAYAGTDIDTFRNNPKLQIEAAIKLAKSFEQGFNDEDRKLAEQKGFTPFGLLGGAWLGGVGGVRKFLKGQGNPSDRHWSKEGKGTDVASRIKMFNFRKGGVVKGQTGLIAERDTVKDYKPEIPTDPIQTPLKRAEEQLVRKSLEFNDKVFQKISPYDIRLIDYIKSKEGFRPKPGKDPTDGKYTVGYGLTDSKLIEKYKDGITEEEATRYLIQHLRQGSASLQSMPYYDNLNIGQKSALNDLIYNTGWYGFKNKSPNLQKALNKGNFKTAVSNINHGETQARGLKIRRRENRDMFNGNFWKQ